MPIDIIDDLGKKQNSPASENSSILDLAANNPMINSILGFGDAARDLGLGAANLIPGVHTKKYMEPSSEGLAYDAGNIAGNIGTFAGGGEVAEGLGLAGKLAAMLGGEGSIAGKAAMNPTIQRIAGSSAFGAASNPDFSGQGALEGAGIQTGLEALSPVGRGIATAYSKVNQAPAYEALVQKLTGGMQPQDLRKSIANKIMGIAQDTGDTVKSKYTEVLDKFGNYPMKQTGNEYRSIGKNYFNDLPVDDSLKQAHQDYLKSPTLEKAHFLQSQLGREKQYYEDLVKNKQATGDDKDILNKLRGPYNKANNDIDSFFDKRNKAYGDKYEDARKYAREEFYPLYGNKSLRDVVTGTNSNPTAGDISSIFKSPENFTTRLAQKMGEEGQANILGSHTYGDINKGNPSALVNKLNESALSEKGMSDYVTPNTGNLRDNLVQILNRRASIAKMAPTISGMAAGAGDLLTGGSLGNSGMATLGASNLANLLAKSNLLEKGYQAAERTVPKAYKTGKKITAPLLMQYLKGNQ